MLKLTTTELDETWLFFDRIRNILIEVTYRAFHGFGITKFAYGGSILGSSQFTLLSHLPLKMMLKFKVAKINSKIIILLH